MTRLLEQAFKVVSRLPETDQDALAQLLLDELRSEKTWEELLTESEDVLQTLADEALAEKRQGKTVPLDLKRL